MNELNLKDFRKKYNLSQSELAEIVGKTIRAIQSWEQGKRKMPQSVIIILKNYTQKYEKNDSKTLHNQKEKEDYLFETIINKPHDSQMEILFNRILHLEQEQKNSSDAINKLSEDLRISQIINKGLLNNIVKHLKINPEDIERERLNEELLDKNKTAIN